VSFRALDGLFDFQSTRRNPAIRSQLARPPSPLSPLKGSWQGNHSQWSHPKKFVHHRKPCSPAAGGPLTCKRRPSCTRRALDNWERRLGYLYLGWCRYHHPLVRRRKQKDETMPTKPKLPSSKPTEISSKKRIKATLVIHGGWVAGAKSERSDSGNPNLKSRRTDQTTGVRIFDISADEKARVPR
jgi:hypothetical protein